MRHVAVPHMPYASSSKSPTYCAAFYTPELQILTHSHIYVHVPLLLLLPLLYDLFYGLQWDSIAHCVYDPLPMTPPIQSSVCEYTNVSRYDVACTPGLARWPFSRQICTFLLSSSLKIFQTFRKSVLFKLCIFYIILMKIFWKSTYIIYKSLSWFFYSIFNHEQENL